MRRKYSSLPNFTVCSSVIVDMLQQLQCLKEKYEDSVLVLIHLELKENKTAIQLLEQALQTHLKIQNQLYQNYETVLEEHENKALKGDNEISRDATKVKEEHDLANIEVTGFVKVEHDYDDIDHPIENIEDNMEESENDDDKAWEMKDESSGNGSDSDESTPKKVYKNHTKGEKKFPCDKCQKKFDRPWKLEKHQ